MLIPEQLKEIHTYIANSLNQFLNKLELIGYPIKNVSALNNAYLVFSGELAEEIKSNETKKISYSSLWNKKSLSSSQGSGSRLISDKIATADVLDSIFFKSIDDNDNVIKDMDWNDSCGYFYDLNDLNLPNSLITGVSFNKEFAFDYITGNTVEFYEEFAVMCIASGDAAASTDKEEFIPGNGCAIPFEFPYPSEEEIIPVTAKIPLSSNVGIGIRVKKDPTIPLKPESIALKMATASNIVIEYIDLSLNLGLNF